MNLILTRLRRERVGRAEHRAAGLDGIKALPDHGDDRSSRHVLDEAREEGLALEVLVVCVYRSSSIHRISTSSAARLTLLEVLRGSVDHLERDKLEATLLETGDDGANETALDTVRLWRRVYALLSTLQAIGAQLIVYLDHDIGLLGSRHCV